MKQRKYMWISGCVLILLLIVIVFFMVNSTKDSTPTTVPNQEDKTVNDVETNDDDPEEVDGPYEPITLRTVNTSEFSNPINTAGADPYVMYKDGYYYFTRTLGHRIDLWKSRTLTGIDLGERRTVWTKPTTLHDIWAPEIHFTDGKWYIYYTANTGCGDDCRGIYVLENDSVNPMEGEWIDKGKINMEYSGLDGTVFTHKDELYFLYAAYGNWSGAHGSGIVIAKMENPWTLKGKQELLTYPENEWEKFGMHVNEGAVILKRDDKLHLVFSGSACWVDQYAIGMLTTTVDSDLLSKDSWEKAEGPLFSMSIDNGVYGPGHNYFVTSKDGEEVWNVYHGNSNMGEGCGPRPTRLQVVNWDTNGVPDFGIPTSGPLSVPSGEYRFEAEHANNIQGEINEEAVTLSKTGDRFEIADINVPEAGVYTMTIMYKGIENPAAAVSVNGESYDVPFSSAEEFTTVTVDVELNKGYNNSISFDYENSGIEIDYIELEGNVPFQIEYGASYHFVNPNGNMAMHVGVGNNVMTYNVENDETAQHWEFTPLADGSYKITNADSGLALTISGDENKDGANVVVLDWLDIDKQKWKIDHRGNGYYKIINVANGEALDVTAASMDPGVNIGTWKDIPNGPAQFWLLYKVE
ncbi:family 43 glycosylhydrolase [Lederbergia graminis]|uniref:Family 43 glycosylhydrolase n=1 Tax=Lederbergia graminis TaxID=735518 RepID=A0ABW0LFK9_9BACI